MALTKKKATKVTGNIVNGVARELKTETPEYVDTLMKGAMQDVIDDITAGNATYVAGIKVAVTADQATNGLYLFPPMIRQKIIDNNTSAVVLDEVDSRFGTKPFWILGGYSYMWDTDTKATAAEDALIHAMDYTNRDNWYEEGTCSNTSYTTSGTCISNGAIWTSTKGVTITEKQDVQTVYTSKITTITT